MRWIVAAAGRVGTWVVFAALASLGFGSQAAGFEWAIKAGGPNPPPSGELTIVRFDPGRSVAVDATGQAYVVGAFSGTAPFGDRVVVSRGATDAFIAKVDPQGRVIWVKAFGSVRDDEAVQVALDAAGRPIVIGTYRATLDFGDRVLEPQAPYRTNGFVAKFDADGTTLWATGFDMTGATAGEINLLNGLALAPDGRLYVVGTFTGTMTAGAITVTSAGRTDAFMARLDAEGRPQWVRPWGGADRESFLAVDIDAAGLPNVTGSFTGPVTLGTTSLTTSAPYGAFLARFDADGEVLKVTPLITTGAGSGFVTGVKTERSGSALVFGYVYGSLRIGSTDIVSPGPESRSFVAKLAPDGQVAWVLPLLPDQGASWVASVLPDRAGRVVVTGSWSGTIDLPGGIRSSGVPGRNRLFVATVDGATGQVRWVQTAAGDGADDGAAPLGAVLDPSGAVVLSGTTCGTVHFGATTLVTGASIDPDRTVDCDILVAKLRLPVAPTGDMNGDGKPDLLWQNAVTGERAAWFLDGTSYVGGAGLGVIPVEWDMAGTGDFDGDGQADIVWQHRITGDRTVWLMRGTTLAGSLGLGNVPPEWDIAAVADLNGDGRPDLVWQNTRTGERAVWFLDGARYLGGVGLGVIPTEWVIAGAGDLDGDGWVDLVWEHAVSGLRHVWLMDAGVQGLSVKGGATLTTLPIEWRIARLGDFDGDGQTDVVWENRSTGERVVWYLDGLRLKGGQGLGVVPAEWRVVN